MISKFLLFLIGVSFFINFNGYGQPITDREKEIYYDLTEKLYFAEGDTQKAYAQISEKYNINQEEIFSIEDKGRFQEFSELESQVAQAIRAKMSTLPKQSQRADISKIYRQVADEFGISFSEVAEIAYRASSVSSY